MNLACICWNLLVPSARVVKFFPTATQQFQHEAIHLLGRFAPSLQSTRSFKWWVFCGSVIGASAYP